MSSVRQNNPGWTFDLRYPVFRFETAPLRPGAIWSAGAVPEGMGYLRHCMWLTAYSHAIKVQCKEEQVKDKYCKGTIGDLEFTRKVSRFSESIYTIESIVSPHNHGVAFVS